MASPFRKPPRRLVGVVAAALLLLTLASRAPAQGLGEPTARDSSVGYIDAAPPADELRLRFDASIRDPRPSRAAFFWSPGPPFGPGPRLPERSVDYQDLSSYLETAWTTRFSTFVEVPVRFLEPEVNPRQAGLSDVNAGFKYAFVRRDDLVATFQLRTYVPTGDAGRGLGTGHVDLEPALLLLKRFDERLSFEGELRDLIPVGGGDFAGNVVRYGAGLDYDLWDLEKVSVVPVAELVGWTVLDGRESVLQPAGTAVVKDAAGETIVNAKIGLRFKTAAWGQVYAGYGRPLTGDRWYENTFRLEWRLLY